MSDEIENGFDATDADTAGLVAVLEGGAPPEAEAPAPAAAAPAAPAADTQVVDVDDDATELDPAAPPAAPEAEAAPEVDPEDLDDNPEDKDPAFVALTKRRQHLRALKAEAIAGAKPQLDALSAEIQTHRQRIQEQDALVSKASDLMRALRTNPKPLLEAAGWSLQALAQLEVSGQAPPEIAARIQQQQAQEAAQRAQQAQQQGSQVEAQLRQLQADNARLEAMPRLQSGIEQELALDPEAYPAASLMPAGKRAEAAWSAMLEHYQRTGIELDIGEVLSTIEGRLASIVDIKQLKAQRAGANRPEQRKPAPLPDKLAVAPPTGGQVDSFGSSNEEAELAALAEQFIS